jgi:hypothetical protein
VQATVIRDTSREALQAKIKCRVNDGATICTDAHKGYSGLEESYIHSFVDHAVKYTGGTSPRTELRTSGAYSSGSFTVHTSSPSLSTYPVTWTSSPSGSTSGAGRTLPGSCKRFSK